MRLIHLSDLHFGHPNPTYDYDLIKAALIRLITEDRNPSIIILGGDIIYAGVTEGYWQAERFFVDLIRECGDKITEVIGCPGNHDIINDELPEFTHFSRFFYALRDNGDFNFSKGTFVEKEYENLYILLANTSYHLDHKFGLISPDTLQELTKKNSQLQKYKHKLIVTHHHFINQYEENNSSIRNAYPALCLLDKCGFNYILHGHQHSHQQLSIGENKIKILASRSLSFNTQGYQNGVTILNVNEDTIETEVYTLSPDIEPPNLTFIKQITT